MPMRGAKKHVDRLKRLSGPRMEKALEEALMDAARGIQKEAKDSIARGSGGGRASSPGQAPNRQSGELEEGIHAVQTGPLRAEVQSRAPYSSALEFGTSAMGARPFLRPARDKVRKQLGKDAAVRIGKVVRDSG